MNNPNPPGTTPARSGGVKHTKAGDWHAARQRGERLPEHEIEPPEQPSTDDARTYVAHKGVIWRRSSVGWSSVDRHVAPKLLAVYLADASNTSDWFHKLARIYAAELDHALREVGLIQDQAA